MGIRQAVKNEEFAAGNNIQDGFFYSNFTTGIPSAFFFDLNQTIGLDRTHIMPMWYGPRNYTIVGKRDNPNFEPLKQAVDVFVAQYKMVTGVTLRFAEFESETELFDFIRSGEYQKDSRKDGILFAIGVPEGVKNYTYSIYMSANFPNTVPNTQLPPITAKPNFDNFDLYAQGGFLTLQYVLANHVMMQELGPDTQFTLEAFIAPGQTKAFTKDVFMDNIGRTIALFILLIFIAPQYRLIGFITVEKASRAREGMKIMGLNDAPYWLSWFLYYFVVCLIISILCAILFAVFLYPNSSFI